MAYDNVVVETGDLNHLGDFRHSHSSAGSTREARGDSNLFGTPFCETHEPSCPVQRQYREFGEDWVYDPIHNMRAIGDLRNSLLQKELLRTETRGTPLFEKLPNHTHVRFLLAIIRTTRVFLN